MANTPILALPYPVEEAPADVPVDLEALAMAIDAYGLALATPGDLKLSAAIAAPAGWLVCDGRAVSRATYAALFTAIGTSNGVGDGSTTFNLPDYQGRALVGAGAGAGLTARALGAKGGEEAHHLVVAELPSHNHPDAGHSHPPWPSYAGYIMSSGNPQAYGLPAAATQPVQVGGLGATGTGYASPQAAGGDAVHNNMQPFAAVNVLIKT